MAAANTCTPNDNFVKILGILEKDTDAQKRVASALESISAQLARGVSMGSSGAGTYRPTGTAESSSVALEPAKTINIKDTFKVDQGLVDDYIRAKQDSSLSGLLEAPISLINKIPKTNQEQKVSTILLSNIPDAAKVLLSSPELEVKLLITSTLVDNGDYELLVKLLKLNKEEYDHKRKLQKIIEDTYKNTKYNAFIYRSPDPANPKKQQRIDITNIDLPGGIIKQTFNKLSEVNATEDEIQFWKNMILPPSITAYVSKEGDFDKATISYIKKKLLPSTETYVVKTSGAKSMTNKGGLSKTSIKLPEKPKDILEDSREIFEAFILPGEDELKKYIARAKDISRQIITDPVKRKNEMYLAENDKQKIVEFLNKLEKHIAAATPSTVVTPSTTSQESPKNVATPSTTSQESPKNVATPSTAQEEPPRNARASLMAMLAARGTKQGGGAKRKAKRTTRKRKAKRVQKKTRKTHN